ncbi:uroporphyrinogen decarboxylase family protein [Saccharicrinis fermentans]|uniref:Methylcobalamin:coenzyme M methyltransferase n=1 Tax=Saccharicrinis fermentans DSM 9555 = JCM 21142 TaxID=869213 RepID=W7Y5T1_9BACT|nr:uroporphyrinogen decarboxylase family protein [Saccharicrinis fermentans]GAF03502.1 methylcobalamin:coenzyme M methyltransferase [Saccharicrinis fermentans DSM 9555 = JCM 21142]
MTSKERVLATLNRKDVDYPASWLGLPVPAAIPNLYRYFKVNSIPELKRNINDDIWPIEVPYNNAPFNDVGCALQFAELTEGGTQDERTLTAPGFFRGKTDPSEIDSFNWPNPSDYLDIEKAKQSVEEVSDEYFKMGIMWSAHFQDTCSAFGMEDALTTMMMYPDMFQAVINRITDFYLELNGLFYEATKGKLDAVLIGNDFGSQTALMVDPDMLRSYVFPGTKKLIDQAKSYGLKVVHHSCGSIFPIIQDLYDMGVDIVHPIQALASDMSAEHLSKEFKKGAFCGAVDAQELLVNGTPEDIKKRILELKKLFPTGLIISPSHEAILPDIAPENIEALFQAVKQ